MTVAQAKANRTRAFRAWQKAVGTPLVAAARLKYEAACLACRVAEWEATGGPGGNVPRPS